MPSVYTNNKATVIQIDSKEQIRIYENEDHFQIVRFWKSPEGDQKAFVRIPFTIANEVGLILSGKEDQELLKAFTRKK